MPSDLLRIGHEAIPLPARQRGAVGSGGWSRPGRGHVAGGEASFEANPMTKVDMR